MATRWSGAYKDALEKYAGVDITISEIARKENLSQSGLNRYAIRNGYKERCACGNGTELGHEIQRQRAIKRLSEKARIDSGGTVELIEYVDKNNITFKCSECGSVFTRMMNYKRSISCPTCRDIETVERKAQREQEHLDRERERSEELAKDKICESCGNVFHSVSKTAKYCSDTCSRREKRRRDSKNGKLRLHGVGHRKRARLYGVEYDPSVRLDRLIERDGLICRICGGECDPNDINGGLVGMTYPTIDHIVAMANGGGHTWDNVQVAHFICNSNKRDLLAEELTEEVIAHAKEQAFAYICA